MKAITHWQPYLIWTPTPFMIYIDRANLLYWKSPRKLNWCTVRWHSELQDYHFTIQHVPGKLHTAADLLSRPSRFWLGERQQSEHPNTTQQSFQNSSNLPHQWRLQWLPTSSNSNCIEQVCPTLKPRDDKLRLHVIHWPCRRPYVEKLIRQIGNSPEWWH